MEAQYYALATIEGLHLTCDFVVHSAALFGCAPNYSPTPVGLHKLYSEPYQIYGSIPFSEYRRFAEVAPMDERTLQALQSVTVRRMRDLTCLAWELDPIIAGDFGNDPEVNSSVLHRIVGAGEQILDILRLFLFTPGEDTSIGRLASLGGGVTGIWIGDGIGGRGQFIARKTSNYQLVQDPVERGIQDVRKIYHHDVFRELCSVVCSGSAGDPILTLVLKSLQTFRESRDIQNAEARFLRLAAVAEHLARKKQGKRLAGSALRNSIAELACNGWRDNADVLQTTEELWDSARNPLTHSAETFASIGRDAKHDIAIMEKIVFNMIEATVLDWLVDGTCSDAGEIEGVSSGDIHVGFESDGNVGQRTDDDVPF